MAYLELQYVSTEYYVMPLTGVNKTDHTIQVAFLPQDTDPGPADWENVLWADVYGIGVEYPVIKRGPEGAVGAVVLPKGWWQSWIRIVTSSEDIQFPYDLLWVK